MYHLSFKQLFAGLFVLFAALLAASALSAWTGPTATAPGGNVAAPINVGTTDQVKDAGISVNALATFGSQYIQDKLGIGRVSPVVALDVNGTLRLSNGGEVCQAVTEGSIRYNNSSKVIEYCDGDSWQELGAGSSGETSTYDTTGSFTWTKPSSGTTAQIQCWGAGGGGGGGGSFTNNLGTSYYPGAGGGGGGYVSKQMALAQISSSVTVTVGSGGGGGGAGGMYGSAGSAGGNSSFGSYAVAYGGSGGGGGTVAYEGPTGGSGGSGSGGSTDTGGAGGGAGGNGSAASCASAGGGGGGGSSWNNGSYPAGSGGSSGCDGKGANGGNNGVNGVTATAAGGGGGGGGGVATGGAGAAGKCVVTVS